MNNEQWHTDEQHANPLVPIEKVETYYECPVCGHGSSSKKTIENCIKNHSINADVLESLYKDWNDDDFYTPIDIDDLWSAVDTDDHDKPIGLDTNLLKENLEVYKQWLLRTQNKIDKLLKACSKEKGRN